MAAWWTNIAFIAKLYHDVGLYKDIFKKIGLNLDGVHFGTSLA